MPNLLQKASIVLTPTAYDSGKFLCAKPIDGSGDFDFSRNSAATRVNSQGLVKDVQILSSNLVQNGDFSQLGSEEVSNGSFTNGGTDWDFGTGWSVGDNKAVCDGTNIAYLTQTGVLATGTSYRVQFDIVDYTSGSVKYRDNGLVSGQSFSGVGSYTDYVVAGGGQFRLMSESFIGSITNISVKEVGQNWSLEAGWSIGANKAVGDGTAFTNITQTPILIQNKKVKLTFDILDYVSGTFRLIPSDRQDGLDERFSGNGSYEVIYTSTVDFFRFRQQVFVGSVTNISVIEITNDTNLPRINYEGFSYDGSGNIIPDSGCGSWLWENQSTNLITYSEDFSNSSWFKMNTTITTNTVISPDGTLNASSWITDTAGQKLQRSTIGLTSGNEYTFSIYIKADTNMNVGIGGITSAVVSVAVTTEWQRFEVTQNPNSTTRYPQLRNIGDSGTFYIWGAQLEEQSYATSYIPTSGTLVTRNQDLCTNGGSVSAINSAEGVLYAEIAALANAGTNRAIAISDGSTANAVRFYYIATDNRIIGTVKSGGTTYFNFNSVLSNATDFLKVAISYKLNEFKMYVNGILVFTDTSGNTPINLNELAFDDGAGNANFYGKTKCVAVWKEALSDEELAELTTI